MASLAATPKCNAHDCKYSDVERVCEVKVAVWATQMFNGYRVTFVQVGGCGSQLGRTFNNMAPPSHGALLI